MVFAKPGTPGRKALAQARQQQGSHVEFDPVPLTVVEAQRFDTLVLIERLGQASGRILAAGKQDKCSGVHGENRAGKAMKWAR